MPLDEKTRKILQALGVVLRNRREVVEFRPTIVPSVVHVEQPVEVTNELEAAEVHVHPTVESVPVEVTVDNTEVASALTIMNGRLLAQYEQNERLIRLLTNQPPPVVNVHVPEQPRPNVRVSPPKVTVVKSEPVSIPPVPMMHNRAFTITHSDGTTSRIEETTPPEPEDAQ